MTNDSFISKLPAYLANLRERQADIQRRLYDDVVAGELNGLATAVLSRMQCDALAVAHDLRDLDELLEGVIKTRA